MYTTKQQVDKHVESILRQRSSDFERKKQGFIIASQYVNVKEYQTALRYLDGFLSETSDFYKAYSLRGHIYEALKEPQKAIENYKTSLKLNDRQKDVLIKVCKLYCDTNVDVGSAQYWADKLEQLIPTHEVLSRLREKICLSLGSEENAKELERLYATELSKRPNDVKTHIKLIHLYLDQGRVNEAYTKAVKEEISGLLKGSLDWYRCLVDVFEKYKEESGQRVNGDFHIQLLWAQYQLVLVSLEQAQVGSCLEALKKFDQTLFWTTKMQSASDQWSVFQQEMAAQVYFLSGVLLLKKAKGKCLDYSEACKLCAPCFILSYAVLQPNIRAAWYIQSPSETKAWYYRWYEVGCLRACQSGHMIRRLADIQLQDWVNHIQEELCNMQGKERIYNVLFNRARIEVDCNQSYLYNNSHLNTFNPRLPTDEDLQHLDQATEHLKPDSLHHVIWRALQYFHVREEVQPNYDVHLFDNIQYGSLKLEVASPDTLCQLDVEAFIYAAVFDVANHLQIALPEHRVPQMLPVFIDDHLGSPTQEKWWSAAYRLVHGINKEQQVEFRRILQTGLEKIRLIGRHGLDAATLVHLARTFTDRARENRAKSRDVTLVEIIDSQNALQARVEHYWKGAIKDMENLQCNRNVTLPKYQLFSNRDNQLGEEDVSALLNEARYQLGLFLMENERNDEAVKLFSKVQQPEAAFEEGMCYKQLAENAAEKSFDNQDDPERVNERALFEKALDCLKRVLDQLGTDHKHPLYCKAGDQYEEISTCLERLIINEEPSETSIVLDPVSGSSYINRTSHLNGTLHLTPKSPQAGNRSLVYSTPNSDLRSGYSQRTPMRRLQPSPDRLDVQLQMLSRSNQEIIKEFRKSRKTLQHLESRVEALDISGRKLDDAVYSVTKDVREIQTTSQNSMSRVERLENSSMKTYDDVNMISNDLRRILENNVRHIEVLENATKKRDQEVDFLRRCHEENEEHMKELREEVKNHHKQLHEEINKLFNVVILMQEMQRTSVTLPQHLQQAQASGMMLPPGGLPAFYSAGLRAARGVMSQQYPAGYGSGYPSEYDGSYVQRIVPPMMQSQYMTRSQSIQEDISREPVPEVIPTGDPDYGENSYGEETGEGSYEREEFDKQRQPTDIIYPGGPPAVVSQQNSLGMTTSITGFNQMHSQSVDQQMPGPGFFSASDPTISKMTNGQPLQQFNPPSGADQPSEASSTQAVSAASVSGASLFMMPKGQISTSFPLPMPGTAKPPSVSGMASAISQPPAAGKSPEKHADECDKETDGEGTTPETSFTDYKPLVSLPEVITKSGEEDEIVMFNERAKLYRFVEKQWKERGVGTMKILHNEQTDTVRILMRRDQVLKVCANHRIKADMDIDYKDSSDTKTLTWRATDYTDEVPRLEQYCCRFKTPEIASDFKETFEKAKLIAERNVTPNKSRVTQADGGLKDTPPLYTTSQSSEPVFGSGVASSSGKSVFSFGSTTFGTKQTTSATNMLRSFALKSSEEKMGEHQKVFGGFTFTSPPLLTNNIPTVSKAKPDDETLSKNDDKPKPFAGFSFGSSPQKPGYGIKLDFNQRSSSPASAKLAAEPIETTDSISGKLSKQVKGEENKDDFEQGNEKLFGEKGKLYVNNPDSKEWKERGIGEIQILKDNTKAMYRILMLREQSQKVCADHCLTKNMKLLPMDGNKKSWCWFAEDSVNESESCIEQFAVRFKTEEVSSNFRKVFDECVAALSAISEKSSVTVPDQTGSLESQFKKKPGAWICDDCYVVNMADCKRCVACEALQPGEKEDTVPVMSSSSIILGTTGGFQFTGKTDQSFSFNKGSFQPGATSTTTTSTSSFTTAFDLTKFGTFPANPERENDALKKISEKKDDKAGTGKAFGGQFPPKSDELVKDNAAEKKCIASETVQSEEVYDKAPASCLTSFSSVSSTFKFGSSGGFNFTSSNIVSSGKFPFGLTVKEQDSSNGGAFQSRFEVPSESDDALKPLGMMDIGVAKSDPSGATTDKLKTYENTLKTPTTPLSPGDNGYYVNQEGEDDHIYFTPVIKLPENVKIKTGEEEEELLYYQRAKLFRFLDNEWKERGVGEVRILRHQQTGKTRILMRRDQVLKICMNHVIAGDIELKPMPNAKGNNAWVRHAEDFAEDKLSHEQFAIRFASVELANQFKKVFDAAHNDPDSLPVVEHQPDMKQSKSDSKSSSAAQSETVTTPKSTAAMSFSFKSPDSRKDTHSSKFGENSSSDKVFCRFKSGVFGSSEVFGAFSDTEKLSTSKQDKSSKGTHESQLLAKLLAEPTKEAPSVATVSSSEEDVITVTEVVIPKQKVDEARKWQLPDAFYSYEDRPPCKGCLGCLTDEFDFSTIGSDKTMKIPQKMVKTPEKTADVKDQALDVTNTGADSTTDGEIIQFGNSSMFGDFAALAAKAGNTFAFGKGSSSKSPGWKGAGSTLFSCAQQKQEKHMQNGGDDDNEDVEESPDIHFEPIVQLPEVVDLKTGEEEEEKLFCQRAKLYRFDNGQWKERGVGEMKILRNENTGRLRLLMRREQVLKVVCNHYLTADMVLKPLQTSETTWCWYAVDHTENEPKNEQFALRFKSKELAAVFKEKFIECQEKLRTEGVAR